MKGYLDRHVDEETKVITLMVGAKSEDYHGPVARITWDKDWLHIITDDHEGHVMLNLEALPMLRRALRVIARTTCEPR